MSSLKSAAMILVFATLTCCPAATNNAYAIGSFFDVFTELMVNGQVAFKSVAPTTYPGPVFDTEMLSMTLSSSADPRVVVHAPAPDGSFSIDSFFDITYRVGPVGGPYTVDSFFDVFTELSVSPPTTNPDGSQTFDTEMLSMDLEGAGGPSSNFVLAMAGPPYEHRGHVTVLKSHQDGGYHVDSFFDIFTELSIDGGGSFQPAASSTPMAFSATVVPEPSTWILCVLGGIMLLAFRRRRA